MQAVMGSMNGVWLQNVMTAASAKASRVTAAVAYANTSDPFFEHCFSKGLYLDFYGLLDEDCAVSIPVLERLLLAGPSRVTPRLIKGHFHSKIIWWHGYGAYIGSANLTHSAWSSNVECGVFFEESEIVGTQVQIDLEVQFDYLKANSTPVTQELVKSLKSLRPYDEAANRAKKQVAEKFHDATKHIPSHAGLAAPGPSTPTTAFTRFTSEWSDTLQLLRGLSRDFQNLNARPKWVSADADPTVHFDQFLHAFYYVRVRDAKDDAEDIKTVELVNRAFERNRMDRAGALEDAAKWWAGLSEAPYGEDEFIRSVAPRVKSMFAKDRLATWTAKDFRDTFFEVHAFKTHARQTRNSFFALPIGHKETARERSDRLANWLWSHPQDADHRSVLELLQFLVWGASPANVVERLWIAIKDPRWRFDHLGASSLGEALGWARPEDYPPRNNRTNKALKSLGHDVRLFSD